MVLASELYALSQASIACCDIVRLRTQAISGNPKVLVDLKQWPGVRDLTVTFPCPPTFWRNKKWLVPPSLLTQDGGMDLSKIRVLKVVIADPKLDYDSSSDDDDDDDGDYDYPGFRTGRTKPSISQRKKPGWVDEKPPPDWSHIDNPLTLLSPALPSCLTSLHLDLNNTGTGYHYTIDQFLTKAISSNGLVHLTIRHPSRPLFALAKAMLPFIEQGRLMRLQSLKLVARPSDYGSMDPVKQLIIAIGTRHHLRDLRSVELDGDQGRGDDGNPNLCCLLETPGLDVLPLNRFYHQ